MIISLRSINYEELKNQLTKEDKIVINSCDTCIKACGVGGKANINLLADMLESDGYNVIGKDLISIGCNVKLLKEHKNDIKKKDYYDEATVIIPLICEDGLEAMQMVFEDKKVIQITKTVGIGNLTMDRGVVLTHPFENTKLAKNDEGYDIYELAEKLNLYDSFFDKNDAKISENDMVKFTVDGNEVVAKKGRNLLDVCEENGIEIPHICYHKDLSEFGACRLCLVKIKGRRDLSPACCTRVEEGMEIVSKDEELDHNRKVILELIKSSRNYDTYPTTIPFGTNEYLQMFEDLNVDSSRYEKNDVVYDIDDSSPVIRIDPNKCILCGRCVRACEEVAGMCNIGFVNRGSKTMIAAGLNTKMNQSDCATCMACTNVCPTGALSEKYIHFSGKDFKKEDFHPGN